MHDKVTCSSHGNGKLYIEYALSLINLKLLISFILTGKKYIPCFFNNLN